MKTWLFKLSCQLKLWFRFLFTFGTRSHYSFRLALRMWSIVVGILAGYAVSYYLETEEWTLSRYSLSVMLFAAIFEFFIADIWADKAFPFETERKQAQMEKRLGADAIANISTRLQQAIDRFPACDQLRISATVHVLVELTTNTGLQVREGLLQLTDYVGPYGGKKGRITPINQGVIGRCARTQVREHVDFADELEYRERMVREFGFTVQEAERHTATGRSYLAYPLMSGNKFVGVLYFFTTEPQVFPSVVDNDELDEVSREVVNYMNMARLL